MMLVSGKSKVTVLRRVKNGVDKYNNPRYIEESHEIDKVLISEQSAYLSSDIYQDNPMVDKVLYFENKWEGFFKSNDIIVINGEHFEVSTMPVAWSPFRGSIIKPKVIMTVKRKG